MRFLIAAIAILPTAASAWSNLDRISTAKSLGDVLASEAPCGVAYNQEAISAYISANVPDDDLSFTSTLNTMTAGAEYNISNMSSSSLTAHCSQIKRVASSFGFLSD